MNEISTNDITNVPSTFRDTSKLYGDMKDRERLKAVLMVYGVARDEVEDATDVLLDMMRNVYRRRGYAKRN